VTEDLIMEMTCSALRSPIGSMLLVTDRQGCIRALEFEEHRSRLHRKLREHYGTHVLRDGEAPQAVARALERYFDGDLAAIDSVAVAAAGTEREQAAWAALRRIPAGKTIAYGALGRSVGIGDWRAAVQMGALVGANPVAIIVPCHRVISANGDLKGYAWGLHRKRWLLEHEKALAPKLVAPETAALPGF
jgi:methylated-DNA-[protein]-cysteine S-methyltransferase